MVRHLLEGVVLNKFGKSALVHGAKNMLHYADVMSNLAYYVFPMKAIHVQKHYMLGYMCKPQTLKMEEYMA
jgi:hypothetical protein